MKIKFATKLVALLFIAVSPAAVSAQDSVAFNLKNRHVASVWHWGSKTEVMGINYVVNDTSKAAIVLASYKRNNITRVYGGYLHMPSSVDESEHLKRWNKSLHDNDIKSISLIGTPEWVFPKYRQEMLQFILDNYVEFNRSADLSERLCGLHLDLEIHGLVEWKTASLERKRELLDLLKDTYKEARELLVANGMGNDEIMADIPFWYDKTSAVGWKSEEDKLSWFTEVSKYLQGFTIMDYGNNSVPVLLKRAKWERDNFKGVIEIGLNFEGVGTIWRDRAEFREALANIITQTNSPVAIHRYAFVLKKPGRPLIARVRQKTKEIIQLTLLKK